MGKMCILACRGVVRVYIYICIHVFIFPLVLLFGEACQRWTEAASVSMALSTHPQDRGPVSQAGAVQTGLEASIL